MHRRLVALLSVSILLACDSTASSCEEADVKAAVLAQARSWYLYEDLIPDDLRASEYGTAGALLDALTAPARAQGLERDGWTSLMSASAYAQYFRAGQSVGFGYSLVALGSRPAQRVFVKQVMAGSAAAQAGFVRGDELLAAGDDPGALLDLADADVGVTSPQGQAGITKVFRVLPRGETTPVLRTMVSAAYDVDPVPAWRVWDRTGYLQLRTFIQPAEASLRAAFAAFHDAGVENVIVDLRYNGGGSVTTAEVLANLLAGELAGREMFELSFNAQHADRNEVHAFAVEPAAGTFQRIAFITTGASASASELVPHALDPYRTSSTIAYAGGRTYGKPVGQQVWSLDDCDAVLFLIAFRLENAAGDAGYFGGLPDASSHAPLCPVSDDLEHEQDDPAEAMTAAAKYFVEHGACPPSAATRTLRAAEVVDHLVGAEATPAALEMPGTF